MEACRFYTPSNMHFSMHNNIREAENHPFLDPLPFESCCNSKVMKATGTKQAGCGFTIDNRECDHFEKDRRLVVKISAKDATKQNRMLLTEVRSKFGFVLREIFEMRHTEGEKMSFRQLHSIHAGIFETEEEFREFANDLLVFELESRSINARVNTPSSSLKENIEKSLNNIESDESLIKKVFSHV